MDYTYPWISLSEDGFLIDTTHVLISFSWPFIFAASISYYAFRKISQYIRNRRERQLVDELVREYESQEEQWPTSGSLWHS